MSVEDLQEVISSFLNLEDDWDGYGGGSIDIKTVARGLYLAGTIMSLLDNTEVDFVEAQPCSDGSIEIEIEHNNRCLGWTIYRGQDQVSVYKEENKECISEEMVDFDSLDIEADIEWLLED